jgi:adenylylsulfate kinase-like enzyme
VKNEGVKIIVYGHACSGKSSLAHVISKALRKAKIPNEVRDHDEFVNDTIVEKR